MTERRNALLIEDNAGDARLIEEALAETPDAPFALEHVDRLSRGLARLAQPPAVDVVLLDLNLPDSHGLETLVRVIGHAPRAPILVLTGFDDEASAIAAVHRGAQDYLIKGQVDGRLLARAMRYAIERKRAEEALRSANDRFAMAAAAVNSVIYDWDVAHDTVLWSVGLLELFGYDPTQVEPTAEWWLDRIHPDDRARVHDQLRRDMAQGRDFVCEYRFQHRNGTYLDVWDRGRFQRAPDGTALRMVGTMVDISERKRTEYLKDEFVSTVSHELRTPLATIKEFTAILMDRLAGPVTPRQREHLEVIWSCIARLGRIIDNLLDLATIEAGRVLLHKTRVELGPLLDHVERSMRPLADAKQIAFAVQAPPAAPPLFADTDKLTQVLLNLVSNAIKYTPGPGRVTLRVEEHPGEFQFSVEDTGVGIAAGEVPKLFERFQQLRRVSRMTGSRGTGLGLAISKQLVELHGGHIWVTSVVGQGSAFRFTLPQQRLDEVFRESLQRALEDAKSGTGRVSLVMLALPTLQALKAQYGLEETDRLLKGIEEVMRTLVRRPGDTLVTRWLQGQVVLVLEGVGQADARAIAQRAQQVLAQRTFRLGATELQVPVAAATATYPDEALNHEALLQAAERQLSGAVHPKARLLVVDDELKLRRFLQEALGLREYDVLTAASGPEALALLKQQRVDLIVLDLLMPGMDGGEVYHLLKEDPRTKGIPVVIVTGKGERGSRPPGLEQAPHYLEKPFELEELVAKIREILRSSLKAA